MENQDIKFTFKSLYGYLIEKFGFPSFEEYIKLQKLRDSIVWITKDIFHAGGISKELPLQDAVKNIYLQNSEIYTWNEYLDQWSEYMHKYFIAIKNYIVNKYNESNIVPSGSVSKDGMFEFEDGYKISFTSEAWGSIVTASLEKGKPYSYYMHGNMVLDGEYF